MPDQSPAAGGASILAPGQFEGGRPIGGPMSLFNIGGAPIAVLGGVFSAGFPLGGPVTQIFRGGSAPVPNTLFIATLSPAGPIGTFLIGGQGAPIGEETFGGGGLPIGAPPGAERAIEILQPRTAEVATIGGAPPPALVIGADRNGSESLGG